MTALPSWQTSLDPPLLQRLLRPIRQPTSLDPRLAQRLIDRHYRLIPHSPLLQRLMQRQEQVAGFQSNDVPIVYAQPSSSEAEPPLSTAMPDQPETYRAATTASSPPPSGRDAVIQAKFERPGTPDPDNPAFSLRAPLQSYSPPPSLPVSIGVVMSEDRPSPVDLALTHVSRGVFQAGPFPIQTTTALTSELISRDINSVMQAEDMSLEPAQNSGSTAFLPRVQPLVLSTNNTSISDSFQSNQPTFKLPLASVSSTARVHTTAQSQVAIPTTAINSPVPVVTAQPTTEPTVREIPASPAHLPAVNLNQLADQVERRLKRKLEVERERRGWQR